MPNEAPLSLFACIIGGISLLYLLPQTDGTITFQKSYNCCASAEIVCVSNVQVNHSGVAALESPEEAFCADRSLWRSQILSHVPSSYICIGEFHCLVARHRSRGCALDPEAAAVVQAHTKEDVFVDNCETDDIPTEVVLSVYKNKTTSRMTIRSDSVIGDPYADLSLCESVSDSSKICLESAAHRFVASEGVQITQLCSVDFGLILYTIGPLCTAMLELPCFGGERTWEVSLNWRANTGTTPLREIVVTFGGEASFDCRSVVVGDECSLPGGGIIIEHDIDSSSSGGPPSFEDKVTFRNAEQYIGELAISVVDVDNSILTPENEGFPTVSISFNSDVKMVLDLAIPAEFQSSAKQWDVAKIEPKAGTVTPIDSFVTLPPPDK